MSTSVKTGSDVHACTGKSIETTPTRKVYMSLHTCFLNGKVEALLAFWVV